MVVAVLAILNATALLADSPATPIPYVKASPNGQFYFRMMPGKQEWDNRHAYGEMYEVSEGGDKLLWKTKGWYSFSVFVSDNGRHLVRMGLWSSGDRPSQEDLAVAFYTDGKLVKSYSTKDLVSDPSKIERSVSHYEWYQVIIGLHSRAGINDPFGGEPDTFSLITLADETFSFDIASGKIISEEKAPNNHKEGIGE